MGKLFACLVMFIFAANTCFAAGLELSDIIKTAREAERTKISEAKSCEKAIQPVKNNNMSNNMEQNACEKINPQELSETQSQ